MFIERLPQSQNIPHKLGRNVEHDPRSREFAYTAAPPPEPFTIIWGDSAPVLNQGDVGGCTGWTGADILNTDPYAPVRKAKNNGQFFTDADGLRFYKLATRKDGIKGIYPPNDCGSTGLGLAKALKSLGLITSYTHCFSWEQYLAAIAHQPVCLGTLWTRSMFRSDPEGVVSVRELTKDTIAGGHEYMCRGHDVTRGLNLCRNHWAPSWNAKTLDPKLPGEFWITDADLQRLLSHNGDVTVLHGIGMEVPT